MAGRAVRLAHSSSTSSSKQASESGSYTSELPADSAGRPSTTLRRLLTDVRGLLAEGRAGVATRLLDFLLKQPCLKTPLDAQLESSFQTSQAFPQEVLPGASDFAQQEQGRFAEVLVSLSKRLGANLPGDFSRCTSGEVEESITEVVPGLRKGRTASSLGAIEVVKEEIDGKAEKDEAKVEAMPSLEAEISALEAELLGQEATQGETTSALLATPLPPQPPESARQQVKFAEVPDEVEEITLEDDIVAGASSTKSLLGRRCQSEPRQQQEQPNEPHRQSRSEQPPLHQPPQQGKLRAAQTLVEIWQQAAAQSSHSMDSGQSMGSGQAEVLPQTSRSSRWADVRAVAVGRNTSEAIRSKARAATWKARSIFNAKSLEEEKAAWFGTPSHRFMLEPTSTARLVWDSLGLVIIISEAVTIPLNIAFDLAPPREVDWCSTAFFALDIVMNFVTGFYQNGMLVMRQGMIAKRYLKTWFGIDFFASMPWQYILGDSQYADSSALLRVAKFGKLLKVLRLLRVLKLRGLLHRFEDVFSSYIVLFTISIAKTIFLYMLFCHWIACMWGWIGAEDASLLQLYDLADCEPDGPCEGGIGIHSAPWRQRYGVATAHRGAVYLTSLQFSVGMMTGADMTLSAGNTLERIFLILMMVVGFLVCSIIVSQILLTMQKLTQDMSEFLEDTRAIREFMVSRGVSMVLQTKVKRYMEYQFKSRKVVHQNHKVMMKLSPYLRQEIQEHMNKGVFERHPFFANMDEAFFSEICSAGHSVLYAPGDMVLRKDKLNLSLIFLVRGQLRILDVLPGQSVIIKPPAWLNDQGLFVQSVRRHTVVATGHSEVLTVKRHDLIDLMQHFPLASKYIEQYTQRVFSKDPEVTFCERCGLCGHEVEECWESNSTGGILKGIIKLGTSTNMEHNVSEGGASDVAAKRSTTSIGGMLRMKSLLPTPMAQATSDAWEGSL